MIASIIGQGTTLKCPEEANVNGQGSVDLSDLSLLISYLIVGGTMPPCP
jgi:hypothetical protein